MTQPSQNPIRILLVDDHQSVLWGLVKLIESASPSMEVIGTAADMPNALTMAQREQPDIVLLDVDLNGANSLDSMSDLTKVTKARVLILTGVRDPETHDRAMLAGARGVVNKAESAEIILKAIRVVHQGEIWLDRAATGRVFSRLLNPTSDPASREAVKIASLTSREREIVGVIIDHGRSTNKQISAHLKMSEHTLRNHLTSIYAKLEVGNRLELAIYALKHGLGKSDR